MDKTCKIRNRRFSWTMEVDGKTIEFTGFEIAEYFRDHYAGLGYEVDYKQEQGDVN